MSKKSDITKKQHYIPQVYLRGFSPEYHKGDIRLSKEYTIYFWDKGQNHIMKPVPIKSICYSEYLYEVTGNGGEIVCSNYLEKFFSIMERKFSEYRDILERKAFLKDNLKTKCFLSNKEKSFWATYIVIQILRMPLTLKLAEKVGFETWGDKINVKQAKNIARLFCLPFFYEIKNDSKELQVFNALIDPIKKMSFGIGVDKQAKIVTSDKPVFIHSKKYPCIEYGKIIFPITSELCLFLFGEEDKKHVPKNFLFNINENNREEILKSMVASSQKKIYANHLPDKREMRFIKDVLIKNRANTLD